MGREHVTQLYNILLSMYMMITVTTLFCFSFFLSFSGNNRINFHHFSDHKEEEVG